MAKGDDIQKRLIDFAVGIINLSAKLPKSSAGKHIAGQILRSGTSPAPNYAEARSAESSKDFILMGSAKNKMLFCYICRKWDFSPTQPLYPSKGGTKVPLPFHITNMPRSTIYFLPSP